MSSSRLSVMDQYDLRPDPCDNQLIRMSNCCKYCACLYYYCNDDYCFSFIGYVIAVQMMSCVCDILAMFVEELQQLSQLTKMVADFIFYTLMGW